MVILEGDMKVALIDTAARWWAAQAMANRQAIPAGSGDHWRLEPGVHWAQWAG
jgi:hypothetical protein